MNKNIFCVLFGANISMYPHAFQEYSAVQSTTHPMAIIGRKNQNKILQKIIRI
jgi:hypothetical protein